VAPAAIAAAVAAVLAGAYVAVRRLLGQKLPAEVDVVRDVDDTTAMDSSTGAVRSVQSAEVSLPSATIEALWSPLYLERLARTYWRFLTRATLGLVRVYYTEGERYVCLLARPFKLITFRAPEYEMDGRRGVVRWRIARGLLVARRGHDGDGYLEIDVERRPSKRPGCPRHPHPRLPALARAPRPRRVGRRPFRGARGRPSAVRAAAPRAQRRASANVTIVNPDPL
jgi:hypothetical protein